MKDTKYKSMFAINLHNNSQPYVKVGGGDYQY